MSKTFDHVHVREKLMKNPKGFSGYGDFYLCKASTMSRVSRKMARTERRVFKLETDSLLAEFQKEYRIGYNQWQGFNVHLHEAEDRLLWWEFESDYYETMADFHERERLMDEEAEAMYDSDFNERQYERYCMWDDAFPDHTDKMQDEEETIRHPEYDEYDVWDHFDRQAMVERIRKEPEKDEVQRHKTLGQLLRQAASLYNL